MKAFHFQNAASKPLNSQQAKSLTFKVVKRAKLPHFKNRIVKHHPDHIILDAAVIGEVVLAGEVVLDADSIFSAGILKGAPSYLKEELGKYAHLLRRDPLVHS